MGDAGDQNDSSAAAAGDAATTTTTTTTSNSSNLFLQIVEHPDGSITRPFVPAVPVPFHAADDEHSGSGSPVLFKDVPLNLANDTWLRIYRPNPLPAGEKLPVIIFFHGGGFVLFSAASIFYHASCEAMAGAVGAVVVSLEYRLAPEHRLPAAYDDAVEALLWVRAQAEDPTAAAAEPWLAAHGDFSRCFLMGSSSGANMAYHAGLRAVASPLELPPLTLAGVILNQPYFGGEERTPSEASSEEDPMLPLRANDTLWRLALPEGADRDHEFSNPVAAVAAAGKSTDLLRRLPRCLVKGWSGDPLVDRQKEFVKMMDKEGASVVARIGEGGFHAIELFDAAGAESLFADVREFIAGGAA